MVLRWAVFSIYYLLHSIHSQFASWKYRRIIRLSISSAFGWFILFRRCLTIRSSHSRDDLHHAAHEHCRAIHGHTPIWFALLSLFVELFHLLLVLSPKLSGAVVLESIDGSLLSLTLPIKNVAPCMLLLVACRPTSGFISGRPSSSSSAVYVE